MPFTSLRSLALIAAACGGIAASAAAQQALIAEPSNLPPESFTGDQFVDNRGCIFVRAGFDGTTTWVPRVTRSRQPICGQEPTFAAAVAPATAPAVTDAPKPATVVATAAVDAPQSPPAAATATVQAAVAPPARTRAQTARPQASVPPRIVRSAPQRAAIDTSDRWARPVRTVDRTVPSVEVLPAAGGGTVAVPRTSWIVPRHVFETRVERGVYVPPGYQSAWRDDRLNPWRAWQKVDGYRATQRVWTSTVPRYGIPEGSPALVDDPAAAYRTTAPAPDTRVEAQARVRYEIADGARAVVSTRSAAPRAARYVRVGLFSSQGGADAAAGRLRSAGLPVRFGTQKHDGQSLRAVLVGPFASDDALRDGLVRTRGAGYADATAN